jgi:tetratricopeptide (TPR) repeat protein
MIEDATPIDDLIEEAEQVEAEGDLGAAVELWKAVLGHDRDPIFLCRYGRLSMKMGRSDDALQAFLEALALNSNLPYALDCLGMWYGEHDDPAESLSYFTRSLAIEETSPTYTLRGAAQLRLGLLEEARESFRKSIRINPLNDEAYFNLAVTFAEEQPTESVPLLRRAIELDPEFAPAHSKLGQVLLRLDDKLEAEYHLRRALELNGADRWAYLYLGNLLWSKGDLVNAESCFKRGIQVWPDSSIPYWCLGLFYHYDGKPNDAERLYRRALSIDSEDPVANRSFGQYLMDSGRMETGRMLIERALALDPDEDAIESTLSKLET